MNDPNTYGYQEGVVSPSEPLPQTPGVIPSEYRFSPDELRVLSECNRESFFQRSLPIATTMGVGTYYATQKGYLRHNPRFGVIPKVTLAVVVGYFVGKLSYQQACAEKLMALPGSYIGQLLRERRDGKLGTRTSLGTPGKQGASMFGANPSDIYSDAGPGSSLDLDTDRPLFSDDTYRPDQKAPESPDAVPARPSMTYDELRRKNRGDYADTKKDPYRSEPAARPAPPPPPPAARPARPPHTNQYGDVLE